MAYRILVYTAPRVETSPTARNPPRISVIRAAKIPVQRQWRGFGTAVAINSADVPARITATVSRIPDNIVAGANVNKDQLLIALDASDFRRQVEIAQRTVADLDAQLAMLVVQQEKLSTKLELESQDVSLAENERNRIEKLISRGAANPRDLDTAKRMVIETQIARLESAKTLEELGPRRQQLEAQRSAEQSSLQLAQQNLDRCQITSPIDGTLQSVDIEVGENLNSGDRVARVVNLERIEVPLKLPASGRSKIAIGDRVQLQAANQSDQVWDANIARIGPEDDVSTRTFTVYIELTQNPINSPSATMSRKSLAPGMFVAGIVTSGQSQSRWIVPRRSVQDGRIFVIDGGVIRTRPVDVEFVSEGQHPEFHLPDDQWAVLHTQEPFLRKGDLVVINGSISLHEGQIVDPSLVTATAAPQTEGPVP